MINNFPDQRTTRSAKLKPEFYKDTAEYILGLTNNNDNSLLLERLDAVDGTISDTYYKKVLNPYNATDKKYTRFPADMRNFDIMRDVIRRYMGEYIKQPFDFLVKVNDPDVIARFNEKLAVEMSMLAVQRYINELNAMGATTGQPSQEIPDFQAFYDDFKAKYVDELAIQGQNVLEALIDWTESNIKYMTAFYNYVVLGCAYTYRDIRNGQVYKEVISPLEYFPISNGEPFIEDHNYGVRRFETNLPQLLTNFSDILDEKTYNRIKEMFDKYTDRSGSVQIPLSIFKSKLDGDAYTTFYGRNANRIRDDYYSFTNKSKMVEGYHIVFTTEVKIGTLLYIDPVTGTMSQEVIEDESFTMDPRLGHISLSWEWMNEVWEIYRFGTEFDDVYTIPRPISYQRRDMYNPSKCKLPYNGIEEVVVGTGFTFSIPDVILPFQISRNIFAYYREKIIAKNKDKILIIPQSLLGDTVAQEDKIYRLEASSIFPYDDSEDDAGTKAQHIRVLDASLSQFIAHITELMDRMKQEAWDTVDMNPQRYGDINTSAGKATTEEAIVRSSMGSVIIYTMFEKFLEKEYTADLDYSKGAFIDGKEGSFNKGNGEIGFFSLDVDQHILANYGVHVTSSYDELEKKRKAMDIAFASAQGGNPKLAMETVFANSSKAIKKAFDEFEEANRQYQASIANEKEQIVAQTEQLKAQDKQADRDNQYEIQKMKSESDYRIALLDAEIRLLELETTMNSFAESEVADPNLKSRVEDQKLAIQQMKLELDRQKHSDTMVSKDKDRQSKEKIANMNKNKYDKK